MTFSDLKDEREEVIRALMRTNGIPAGMELFTAGAQPAWDVIKTAIDLSDYYILIIGNRYGSRLPKSLHKTLGNISYTEAEFNYAKTLGLPMLVFVHSNPGGISADNSSDTVADKRLLTKFRNRASQDVTRATFKDAESLGREFFAAWPKLVQANPRDGWVRGNGVRAAGSSTGDADSAPFSPDASEGTMTAAPVPVREVDVVLDKWRNLADQTVQLDCFLACQTVREDSMTGLPFRSQNPLNTPVTMTWKQVFGAIMGTLKRERVRGADRAALGLQTEIWAERAELFPEGFMTQMIGAELGVTRRAAEEWSEGLAPTEEDRAGIAVTWQLELAQSAERVCTSLKRVGLLVEDGDVWWLSSAGIELFEDSLFDNHPASGFVR